jgi:hypothetical protein
MDLKRGKFYDTTSHGLVFCFLTDTQGGTATVFRMDLNGKTDTCPLNCGTAAVPRKEVAQRLRS